MYLNGHPTERLPGNLNLSFAYVEGEGLMMGIKDIAVSSGSACTSASLEPSYVLKALGVGDELAHSSIRFGLGRFTTEEEVDFTIDAVVQEVNRLREMSPLYEMAQAGHRHLEDRVGGALMNRRFATLRQKRYSEESTHGIQQQSPRPLQQPAERRQLRPGGPQPSAPAWSAPRSAATCSSCRSRSTRRPG